MKTWLIIMVRLMSSYKATLLNTWKKSSFHTQAHGKLKKPALEKVSKHAPLRNAALHRTDALLKINLMFLENVIVGLKTDT